MTYFLSFQTSRTLGKKQCINHQRPNKSIHLTSSLLPYFACWPHNILTFLLLAFNVLKFAHLNRSTVSSSSSASPQYRQSFFHLACTTYILFFSRLLPSSIYASQLLPAIEPLLSKVSNDFMSFAKTKTSILVLQNLSASLGCPILH